MSFYDDRSEFDTPMPEAVRNAYQVVAMWEEIRELRRQVIRLEKVENDYGELLTESIKGGQKQVVAWLDLLMSDKVKIVRQED